MQGRKSEKPYKKFKNSSKNIKQQVDEAQRGKKNKDRISHIKFPRFISNVWEMTPVDISFTMKNSRSSSECSEETEGMNW